MKNFLWSKRHFEIHESFISRMYNELLQHSYTSGKCWSAQILWKTGMTTEAEHTHKLWSPKSSPECNETEMNKNQTCAWVHVRFSQVQLFATLRTVAHQAPLSMGFSKKEYWSGLPCPPPEDFPKWGIEPASLTSPALAGGFFTTSATWEAPSVSHRVLFLWRILMDKLL